jgi:hypothetical protein
MAKGIQGHVIDLSLSELDNREKDRNSINNLAGEGLADDLSLFINNLKNTSIIKKTQYVVINIDINGTLEPFIKITDPFIIPFSNRTIVKCGTIDGVVYNSNTTNQFQVKNKLNNQAIDPGLVDIIRYDSVKTINFDNIDPTRFPLTAGTNYSELNSTELKISDIYNINIPAYIDSIETSIDNYLYLKSNSILTYKDNNFNKKITLADSVVIRNLDINGNPITVQNSLEPTDPGIFIVNGTNRFRAFSDNSNPWNTNTTNFTSTIAEKVTVSELEITNPIISGLTITNIPGAISNALVMDPITKTAITNIYYFPVYINGELFNLVTIKE